MGARRQRHIGVTRGLVTAASASYTANTVFGALVGSRLVDSSRFRWVHHAMYIATASLTAAALAMSAVERHGAGLALLPTVIPLAALPHAGGRMRRHAVVASVAAPAFAAALVLVWRRR